MVSPCRWRLEHGALRAACRCRPPASSVGCPRRPASIGAHGGCALTPPNSPPTPSFSSHPERASQPPNRIEQPDTRGSALGNPNAAQPAGNRLSAALIAGRADESAGLGRLLTGRHLRSCRGGLGWPPGAGRLPVTRRPGRPQRRPDLRADSGHLRRGRSVATGRLVPAPLNEARNPEALPTWRALVHRSSHTASTGCPRHDLGAEGSLNRKILTFGSQSRNLAKVLFQWPWGISWRACSGAFSPRPVSPARVFGGS